MLQNTLFFVLFALLVFSLGCGERTVIVDNIPDPENVYFTAEGRLFITGGENIYEIKDDTVGGFVAEALYEEGGNFLGMTEFKGALYILLAKNTPDPHAKPIDLRQLFEQNGAQQVVYELRKNITEYVLLKAPLIGGEALSFEEIYTFDEACMPNGMAADAKGRLYISDTTYFPVGKIIRIDLTKEPLEAENWINTSDGVFSPNGLAVQGNQVYFTDLDLSRPSKITRTLKTAAIDPVDGTAGPVQTLFERTGLSLFDDLLVENIAGKNYFVLTDYFEGRLLFLKESNEGALLLEETPPNYFASPTAISRGRGHFHTDSLVVTEKGIIFEKKSPIGNKVSLFSIVR